MAMQAISDQLPRPNGHDLFVKRNQKFVEEIERDT